MPMPLGVGGPDGVADELEPAERYGVGGAVAVALPVTLARVGWLGGMAEGLLPKVRDGVGDATAVGLSLTEGKGGAAPLGEGNVVGGTVPLGDELTDADAPCESDAVGVPVPDGVAVGVDGGLAVGVSLPDAELVPFAEGAAPGDTLAVGEADVVEEKLREDDGVSEHVTVEVPVHVPVELPVDVCVGELLPQGLTLPVFEGLTPAGNDVVGLADVVGVGVLDGVPVLDPVPKPVTECEGVPEGVELPVNESDPVFDALAPKDNDVVGLALTELLEKVVDEGVLDCAPVLDPVPKPVTECEGVPEGVALPVNESDPVFDALASKDCEVVGLVLTVLLEKVVKRGVLDCVPVLDPVPEPVTECEGVPEGVALPVNESDPVFDALAPKDNDVVGLALTEGVTVTVAGGEVVADVDAPGDAVSEGGPEFVGVGEPLAVPLRDGVRESESEPVGVGVGDNRQSTARTLPMSAKNTCEPPGVDQTPLGPDAVAARGNAPSSAPYTAPLFTSVVTTREAMPTTRTFFDVYVPT
jgi:hypothetical protein